MDRHPHQPTKTRAVHVLIQDRNLGTWCSGSFQTITMNTEVIEFMFAVYCGSVPASTSLNTAAVMFGTNLVH
jgi:hypothetical protein